MTDIVELSTGHVFAKGSVKALTPFSYRGWTLHGIGFIVKFDWGGIDSDKESPLGYRDQFLQEEARRKAVYDECVEKLLGSK